MKFIGQDIYDRVARFRNKVFISGDLSVQDTLTYSSETLTIGADDNGLASFKRQAHSDEAGGRLIIRSGDGGGTNKAGGELALAGGKGTGSAIGGSIAFQSTAAGSSGSSANTLVEIAAFDNVGNLQIDGGLTTGSSIELGHASDTTLARSSAGVVTIEGNTIRTSADYHYQYISFLGNSTVQANGDWEFPGGNGISNHTWTIDSNQNAVTVGSTTISVAQQYQHAGVRVPYAGKLVGVFGAGRNTNADRQFAAGLFVGVPDWGTTNSINATLRSYAAANNESGSYQNRASKIEDLTRDFDLSAGDMIYPAIRGDGTSADTVQVSMTVVIKTLLP